MPYSGPDDPDLPSNVKAKPAGRRAQWVEIFNSVYSKTRDDGEAMRQANGATKQLGVTRVIQADPEGHMPGTKDDMGGMMDMPMPMESAPYGGATTFEELQAYEDAQETSEDIAELTGKFQALIQNIMGDGEMSPTDKAAAIAKASEDFATMAKNPDAEDQSEGGKDWTKWNEEHRGSGGDHGHGQMPGSHSHPDMPKQHNVHDHISQANKYAITFAHPARRNAESAIASLPSKEARLAATEKLNSVLGRGKEEGCTDCGGEKATKTEGGVGGFSPADYADVDNPDEPSTWKLRLSDKPGHHDVTHVAGAITALQPGGFRGNHVDLGGRKSAAVSKISAAIGSLDAPDDTKSNLRDRLAAVKEVGEKYSDEQARDDHGQWVAAGGSISGDIKGEHTHTLGPNMPVGMLGKHANVSVGGGLPKGGLPDGMKLTAFSHEHNMKYQSKDFDEEQGAFAAFKDVNGQWRWAATWSNNFYDRDGEVFPESAHKEYEQYVDETKDYPELWLWHTPGSKSGRADMIAYDEGFCLALGTFDADKGDIAESLSRAKDLGVSHGYTYSPLEVRNGVYLRYRTFEISPLPGHKAANLGTSFAAMKEAPMLTAEKRDWLVKTIGEERAAAIEENSRRMKKELTDRGVSFKEFVEALGETEGVEATKEDGVINAPGFTSSDGGKTWTAVDAKAFGDKKAPPFTKADATDAEDSGPGGDQGADEDTEDASGKKKKEADPTDKIIAAVKELTDPLMTKLDGMRAEYDAKLDAIKTGRDDVIAQAWSAKNWGRDLKSATDSEGNLVDAEKAKAVLTAVGGDQGPADAAAPYVRDLMTLIGAGAQQ